MRHLTKEITIGNNKTSPKSIIKIGGNNKIAIQSMCTTKTKDVASTVKQIKELEDLGCNIIRVAVLNMDDAKAIKEIKKQINIPLVADIHFDYKLALEAIESGVDKLRINPGNIGSIENITKVVNKCKEKHIPIRIGVNMGSLDKEIEKTYGRCAFSLVQSAKKHVKILEDLDFYDIVLSLKASDVLTTIEAYKIASETFDYPLHIGVTEAGPTFNGLIKSGIALGDLLLNGIGDTIRISLTDDPKYEIIAAKELLSNLNLYNKISLTSCPTCGRSQTDLIPLVNEMQEFINTLPNIKLHIAMMGCAVNGPGEAKDADIGIACGINEALLFKKGEIIRKVTKDEIIPTLKNEILEYIKRNTD